MILFFNTSKKKKNVYGPLESLGKWSRAILALFFI